MGFHSLNCEVCGFPLMCAEATRMGGLRRDLSRVTVIASDGTITRGQYDGYGRVYPDAFELRDGQPALRMHGAVIHPMRWDGERWSVKGLHRSHDPSEIEAIMYAINHWETSGNTFDVVIGWDWAYRTMTPQALRAASFNAPHVPVYNTEGHPESAYHGLCHEVTGSTTDYTGPSTTADGQGWPAFMSADVLDAMRDPAVWNEKWASWLPKATDEVPLPRGWIDIVS